MIEHLRSKKAGARLLGIKWAAVELYPGRRGSLSVFLLRRRNSEMQDLSPGQTAPGCSLYQLWFWSVSLPAKPLNVQDKAMRSKLERLIGPKGELAWSLTEIQTMPAVSLPLVAFRCISLCNETFGRISPWGNPQSEYSLPLSSNRPLFIVNQLLSRNKIHLTLAICNVPPRLAYAIREVPNGTGDKALCVLKNIFLHFLYFLKIIKIISSDCGPWN